MGDYAPTDVELDASDMALAVVAGRFNSHITTRLVAGATEALQQFGHVGDVPVHWVPGAFEIPLAAKWLATSGSEQLVLWPFQGKDGPMGKQPKMFAAFAVRVTAVACHPKQEVVAVGYADGTVLLVRIDDGAEVLGKKPGEGPITALGWDAVGTLLAFGTEAGEAGVIDLA